MSTTQSQDSERLKQAQFALGLKQDGKFGPKTLDAIMQLIELVKKLQNLPAGTMEGPPNAT